MKRIEVILCLGAVAVYVSVTEAVSDPNKFLIDFAMSKARECCVGEKLTRVWERQVRNIVEECEYDGVHNYHDEKFDDLPSIVVGLPDPYSHKLGQFPPLGFIPDHAISLGNTGIGYNNVLVHGISTVGHRFKRDSDSLDSAEEGKSFIRSLMTGEKKIRERIANVTCILRNLNVIDDAGNLQIEAMAEATGQLPIDAYLKEDLLLGLDQCSRYVNCLPPPTNPSTLIPFELKRAYAFIRCSQLKRQAACVKKDIRKNIDKNFPRDLRGTLNLGDFSQRMLDILMAEDVQEYEALLL